MPKRTVIIGLDGMPYRLIDDLSQNGTMPNMRSIIDDGIFRQMASAIPEISSVAWSSIITGTNPGEHGTFGFTDFAPGSYRLTFPNFASLQAPAFWERDSEASRRSVILNVPSTYPARELNGALVSGFVALNLEKAVYPPELLDDLKGMDYRVDVNFERAGESIDYFLRDLNRTLDARIAAYRHLWSSEDWDTFMLVFTGVDRLAHFLWDAYEDPAHPRRPDFLDHLARIDDVIGEIAEQLDESDTLLLLSDHGFELLEKEVFINHRLEQEGFLRFDGGEQRKFKDIGAGTTAFALDPGRIYVNDAGRFPNGSVAAGDRDKVLDDLQALLAEWTLDDRPVIRQIYHKDEVFSGPLLDRAPDLIPVAAEGFNLRPTLNTAADWGTDERTGKHSQPDAFLLVRAPGAGGEAVPEEPSVSDVVEVLDRLHSRG